MRKAIILILAMVVALSALPVTFACYSGGWGNWHRFWRPQQIVYCNPTYCNVIFTDISASDNEGTLTLPKEVARTTAYITDLDKKLVITIDNAYPGYQGIVGFCVQNKGAYPATITGITTVPPDPVFYQIGLTGDVKPGITLQVGEIKCGQLVIGDLLQEGTQKKTFTFDITINFDCTPTKCETAYAYHPDYSTCFIDLGYGSWGWTNGPLGYGDYTFPIYAGAAQCDISKGTRVGWLTVNYNGSTATVTYDITGSDYTMTETHLYIGSTAIPPNNKPGVPGQYPYKHDLTNASTDSYTVTGFSGEEIYVIAHAVVCD